MGRKAKDYYDNNATIQHMAQGAIDAFNYAINNLTEKLGKHSI